MPDRWAASEASTCVGTGAEKAMRQGCAQQVGALGIKVRERRSSGGPKTNQQQNMQTMTSSYGNSAICSLSPYTSAHHDCKLGRKAMWLNFSDWRGWDLAVSSIISLTSYQGQPLLPRPPQRCFLLFWLVFQDCILSSSQNLASAPYIPLIFRVPRMPAGGGHLPVCSLLITRTPPSWIKLFTIGSFCHASSFCHVIFTNPYSASLWATLGACY